MKLPPNDLGSMKLQLVQFVYRSIWIPGSMKHMHCRDAAIKHRNRVPLIRSAALRSWLTQRDPDEGCSHPRRLLDWESAQMGTSE